LVSYAFVVSLGVLVVLYGTVVFRQLTGRGPEIAFLFLAAALVLVLGGVLTPLEALLAVSYPVLALLLGMFIFVVALDRAGALGHLAAWMASRARRPEDLPFYLFLGMGLLSTLILNDALAVLGVPLLLALARRLKVPPIPLLLTLAYAVTVGSVLTPLGNPQNLLVALDSGMPDPMGNFVLYLALPTTVNLLLGGWLVRRWFRDRMGASREEFDRWRAHPPRFLPPGDWAARLSRHPSVAIFPVTMGVLLTFSVGGALRLLPALPIEEIVLGGAVVALLLEPGRRVILRSVDYVTLLRFVGLFVVMAAAGQGGVVGALAHALSFSSPVQGHATPTGLGSFMLSTVGGVQIFSNVPWVALSIPLLTAQGYGSGTVVAWLSLASASTLAGNLTFLGAASNLIIVNQAERSGVRLRLGEFVRYGGPLTALTLAVTYLFLLSHL
jgi:Na+/H+ antiporter NhaD/arsenite permease-like protein